MTPTLRSFGTPIKVLRAVFKVYNAQDGVGSSDLPRYLQATYFTFDSSLWHLEVGNDVHIANTMHFVNWIRGDLSDAALGAHPINTAHLGVDVVTTIPYGPRISIGYLSFYCCDAYKRGEYIRIYLSEQMFNRLDLIY